MGTVGGRLRRAGHRLPWPGSCMPAARSTATLLPLHRHRPALLQVRESLGQAGDLATETAALLSMEQVRRGRVGCWGWGLQGRSAWVPLLSGQASLGPTLAVGRLAQACPSARATTVLLCSSSFFIAARSPTTTPSRPRCWPACRPRPGPSARRSSRGAATSGDAGHGLACSRVGVGRLEGSALHKPCDVRSAAVLAAPPLPPAAPSGLPRRHAGCPGPRPPPRSSWPSARSTCAAYPPSP